MKRSFLLLGLIITAYAFAANNDEQLHTAIFNPTFKTLKAQHSKGFMYPLVLKAGSDEKIIVSFDELSDEFRYLRCRLVHCNADWTKSSLLDSEIVDGFNEMLVEDYAFSSNTFVHYVNYRIEIPSPDIRPLVSGNYVLQIYEENDEDNTLLQLRFSVDEGLVDIYASASGNTDRGFNTGWQQVSLTVSTENYRIRDPYSDIIVVVVQNDRYDNAVTLKSPMRVTGNEVVYEHIPSLIFPAGNEFRRFETVRTDYPGIGIDSIRYYGQLYHVYLHNDKERATIPYSYDQTQFGRFMVREYNATDSDLGADYVSVHFTLEFPEIMNADVYVDGGMTLHTFSEANRMYYDRDSNQYKLTLPLKQGSYNYQYLVLPHGETRADVMPIEGNHYETVNEYTIKVFESRPGARADRLIGSATLYSGK